MTEVSLYVAVISDFLEVSHLFHMAGGCTVFSTLCVPETPAALYGEVKLCLPLCVSGTDKPESQPIISGT